MQNHLKDLKMGKASNHIDPELMKICNLPIKIIMLQSPIEWLQTFWEDVDRQLEKFSFKNTVEGKRIQVVTGVLSIGLTVCKLIVNIIIDIL